MAVSTDIAWLIECVVRAATTVQARKHALRAAELELAGARQRLESGIDEATEAAREPDETEDDE